jgi:hypothetical protein
MRSHPHRIRRIVQVFRQDSRPMRSTDFELHIDVSSRADATLAQAMPLPANDA